MVDSQFFFFSYPMIPIFSSQIHKMGANSIGGADTSRDESGSWLSAGGGNHDSKDYSY